MTRFALLLAPALALAACTTNTETADAPAPDAAEAELLAVGELAETVGTPPPADAVALTAGQAVAQADALNGQAVVVEGTIAEVCQAKGCWLTLQNDAGVPFRVTVPSGEDGYAFTFPKDIAGARVRLAGTLAVEETDVETLRHFAQDEGQSPEAVEAITEPQRTVVLSPTGARIDREPAQA